MRRGHTPLGYRIENGAATLCEEEARKIRDVYAGYLSGLSYVEAARKAGLSMSHCSVKRLMQNAHYLGDDFYPAIIDPETYEAAEQERQRRSTALGRDNLPKRTPETPRVATHFALGTCEKRLKDPYQRAAYIYSLIECEG